MLVNVALLSVILSKLIKYKILSSHYRRFGLNSHLIVIYFWNDQTRVSRLRLLAYRDRIADEIECSIRGVSDLSLATRLPLVSKGRKTLVSRYVKSRTLL